MRLVIENFLKALNEIEEKDYSTFKVILNKENLNIFKEKFSTYENNFVTKLNEKYAILSHLNHIEEPKELIRQLQIPKKYAYSSFGDDEIKNSFIKLLELEDESVDSFEEYILIPDFIIHKSEKDISLENQRLIAEVKTEKYLSYKKFAYDFLKLIIYLNKFNFQNSIFLAVNIKYTTILKYIDQYFNDGLYKPFDNEKLYIIIKENFNSKPIVFNLKEFYKN